MYRDYYKLKADPFRLTPDPLFASSHQSYRRAQGQMQRALEQGDGMLVVTGGAGTGKTTLIEHFLARLNPAEVLGARVVGTPLANENLLRKVGYAFGLEAKDLDPATLLCDLQALLAGQTHARALLIVDEAHNLSDEAFDEVRMLLNMSAGTQPLLQIFLVGQETLQDALHRPALQQLHQRIMATCVLTPLSLRETYDYVLYRLHRAGWRGNPAIGIYTFILIHRFSQGLPRYISKLCSRLLAHGAHLNRQRLNLDDVVAVIEQMQSELLLPSPCESPAGAAAPLPGIPDLINSKALPNAQRISPTYEEQEFLESQPSVVQDVPASVVTSARKDLNAAIAVTAGPAAPGGSTASETGPGTADVQASFGEAFTQNLAGVAQKFKAATFFLGRKSLRFMSWLYDSSKNVQSLRPVAKSAAATLKRTIARAWAWCSAALSLCADRIGPFAARMGAGKLAASVAVLALMLLGIFQLSDFKANEQYGNNAAAPTVSVPAAPDNEQSPSQDVAVAPDVSVPASANGEQSSLQEVAVVTRQPAPELSRSLPVATSNIVEQQHRQSSSLHLEGSAEELLPPPSAENSRASAQGTPASLATVETQRKTAAELEPAIAADSAASEIAQPADTPPGETVSADRIATTRESQIEELLVLANQALARDRLRVPAKENAWHYYGEVLTLDPDNRAAQLGMLNIASRYRNLAVAGLRRQEYDKAEAYIRRGLSVVAGDPALLSLQEDVQKQRIEHQQRQAQEALLALQDSEPESDGPVVEQPSGPGRLFGALRRVFTGDRASP